MRGVVQLKEAVNYSEDRINIDSVTLENFVTTDNLLQNKLGLTTAVNLPPQEGRLPSFNSDNILVANIRPYLKKIWFSNRNGGCSADVLVFTVKNEYDPKFVYYSMYRDDFFNHMMRGAKGTKMPRGDKNQIMEFTLPNFKKSIQKKISAVLSSLDAKIELNNRINVELEAMAKTLYDYWFVQFDFPISKEQAKAMGKPELTGKPYKSSGGKMAYNDTLKREIPEGWEVYPLSKLLRYNYNSIGKQNFYEMINYLDTSSLTKNYLESTQSFNVENDKVPSRAKRIVSKNDILYSTVRPNQFHYGIIKYPIKNLIASTGFVQLNSKKDWVSNDLIYTFLTSRWVTERLQQIAELSVSAYPSISPNDILDLQIALPKQEKNLSFMNSKFDMIYNMVSINHLESQQLAQLRDWLLPMLMNGQVTVK